MRPSASSIIATVLFAGCAPGADDVGRERTSAGADEPSYEIILVDGSPDYFRVRVELPAVPTHLATSELGAGGLERGWATFIESVRVTRATGESLPVVEDGSRGWRVDVPQPAASSAPVTLEYEVHLAHDTVAWDGGVDGAALSLPWGAFASGRALFVVPKPYEGPVRVRFSPGPGRVAVTPWPGVPDGVEGTLLAPNPTTLTESYVFVGDFQTFTVERGGFELAFALGGPSVVGRADELRALSSRAFDYFIDLMGDAPRPAPDEPGARILVGINEAEMTDGEVIGSHINILLSADPDPFGRFFSRFGVVHELFHLWNGKSIRSAGPDDWFTEGLTNYYALKALHSSGDLSEDEFFGIVADMFYARYVSDGGYGTLSLRGAMEDKHGHWGVVYGGGMFAGICLDAAVRGASGDAASLDGVMRDMFDRLGGSPDEFELDDVAASVRRHGGFDPTPFFDRHVRGAEPIPVERCLADFGLDATIEDGRLAVSRPAADGPLSRRIDGLLGRLEPGDAPAD